MPGGQYGAALLGGDLVRPDAHREHSGPGAERGGRGAGARAQAGLEVDAVHAGLCERPAHVLVGVGGQHGGVRLVARRRVETVGGGESDLRLAEGGRQVGRRRARPLDPCGDQVDLG